MQCAQQNKPLCRMTKSRYYFRYFQQGCVQFTAQHKGTEGPINEQQPVRSLLVPSKFRYGYTALQNTSATGTLKTH